MCYLLSIGSKEKLGGTASSVPITLCSYWYNTQKTQEGTPGVWNETAGKGHPANWKIQDHIYC